VARGGRPATRFAWRASWTAAGSDWFERLQLDNRGGETVITGTLPDQSALHGVLDRVRDLGLSIISVRRLPPEQTEGAPR
jgi:hypothetical protein